MIFWFPYQYFWKPFPTIKINMQNQKKIKREINKINIPWKLAGAFFLSDKLVWTGLLQVHWPFSRSRHAVPFSRSLQGELSFFKVQCFSLLAPFLPWSEGNGAKFYIWEQPLHSPLLKTPLDLQKTWECSSSQQSLLRRKYSVSLGLRILHSQLNVEKCDVSSQCGRASRLCKRFFT